MDSLEQEDRQEEQQSQRSWLEGLNVQMLALAVSIFATILAIMTLQGIKEQESGAYPCKDYGYLKTLTKISVALVALVAVYFFYLAYEEHKRNPEDKLLGLLFVANILAIGAAILKIDATYFPNHLTTDDLEAALE